MAGVDSDLLSESRENILWKRLKKGAIESLGNYYTKHCELKESFSSVDPGCGLLHRLVTIHSEDEIFMLKDGKRETVIYQSDVQAARTAIEFLPKSGIVTAITYLEEYVHDILGKLYETLHENLTYEELKSFWPDPFAPFLKGNDKKILTQLFSYADGKLNDDIIKLAQKHKIDAMNTLEKPTWDSVTKCLETLFGTSSPLSSVKSLMESILNTLCSDETLKNHDSIIGWRLQYETGDDNKLREKYQVIPRDVATLDDMANFYYGLRCIFAHGNPTKTIEVGVLSKPKPKWNFQIAEFQKYIPEKDDIQVDIILKRYEHKTIEKTKYLGLAIRKVTTTVRKGDKITKFKQTKRYDKKTNEWKHTKLRTKETLPSFDEFLTESDEKKAREAVCANYKKQWDSAKDGTLAADYSLYLSTANFSIFYSNIIAILSLAKCYSIIYGLSTPANGSLQEILEAINELRKNKYMLIT